MTSASYPASMDGRRVLITGASSGIGEATARAIASAGGRVALCARRADRIEAVAAGIGLGAEWVKADVTDRNELRAAIDELAGRLGGLDGVIANAGTSLFSSSIDGDPADWERLIDLNLTAALATVRFALPHFGDTGPRDVGLLGSSAATTPNAVTTVYSVTKRGIAAFADGLRLELAPLWIRVCLFEVGATATEILGISVNQGRAADEILTTAPGRFRALQSSDVAEAIVFAFSRPEKVGITTLGIRPNGQM